MAEPKPALATPGATMFLLPRATLDAYLDVAKISKKENRVMFIATNTPHSIHNGIALDWTDDFIRLKDVYGAEVVVGLVPGVYVGITNTKLARTA